MFLIFTALSKKSILITNEDYTNKLILHFVITATYKQTSDVHDHTYILDCSCNSTHLSAATVLDAVGVRPW